MTTVKEWINEIPGMQWQLIRMVRVIENGIVIDGYNEFIDTRKEAN